jgi:hypothetical protein
MSDDRFYGMQRKIAVQAAVINRLEREVLGLRSTKNRLATELTEALLNKRKGLPKGEELFTFGGGMLLKGTREAVAAARALYDRAAYAEHMNTVFWARLARLRAQFRGFAVEFESVMEKQPCQ